MKDIYVMFAGYNRWANDRVYAAARALPEDAHLADRGAFFGSVHRTLNHLIVTDRIWMHRFTGEGPVHVRLDEVPYDNLASLSEARVAEDERIIRFVDDLSEAQLASTFTYRPISNPRDVTQPLAPVLSHLFNHETHHRGQVHALVTAIAGRDAGPSLDLIAYQRETGQGMR